jgi:VanZ family protein
VKTAPAPCGTPPYTSGFRIAFIGTTLLIAYLAFAQVEETPIHTLNDKFGHGLAFLTLAFLLDFATPRKNWGWIKFLPLLTYGLLIEWVQYYLPYREFSLWDLAADALGLLVYPLSLPMIKRIPGLALRWNSVTY